jgi:hypothetical protein
MRIGHWLLLVGAFIAGGVVVVRAEESPIEVYVPDVLTSPGKAIELQARVAESAPEGILGLPEKELDFFVQGRRVGQATTDQEGWASLPFTPKMRGNLQLVVKGLPPSLVTSVQGRGVLLSWERRRPIILIDLPVLAAETIVSDSASLPYSGSGLFLGEPQSAAAFELGKLAEFYYNLIYLDRTGLGKVDTIQLWLRKHDFPPGMIKILPKESAALVGLLKTLKTEGWENVSAGIGQTADFANALVPNRIATVIIQQPGSSESFPRRAVLLNDWTRIRRHL